MIARLRADARLLPVLAALVVAGGIVAAGNATVAQAGTYAAIFACAAIGLSVLLGNTAQISIGQAGFFAIGAYTVGVLTGGGTWPFWPAALLGTALAALAGIVVGFIALRFRGHYLAMATLAFGLIVVGTIHETALLGGAIGFPDIPHAQLFGTPLIGVPGYVFAWSITLAVALITLVILRSRTGRAFEALRNDELAAEISGVPTRRYKIAAFTYAGALAGLAGALYAAYLGLITPDAVGALLSVTLLLMVVLGGSGGVSGAIVGAALIGTLDIAGHQYDWRQVAYGAVVILVVVAAPGGIAGFVRARIGRTGGAPRPASIAIARQPKAVPQPLAVERVTKRFGGLVAVDDVSFALQPGTLTSLIGPNGAGKTTLFNAICGIGRLDAGCIRIGGVETTSEPPHRTIARGLGRTFQNARLFADMTVLENVMTGAFTADRPLERAEAALTRFGLEPLASTLAKDLAFGDRRRVELARAVAADPWLLLVDEPAAGLNHAERARLHDDLLALRDDGRTLLLIEHDMRLVMAISERVMVLEFGRLIADGAPATVRNDPRVISAYLGTAN